MNDTADFTSAHFLDSTRFWIQKVLVPILVCIGVAGNTVTVIVLTRKRMRCSTNIYLTALAVADIVYLLFVFTLSFSHYKNINDRKYELYWRFYGIIHWLCDAASGTSIWLTVSFTIERYIAVCHPIKGKVLCTESRAKSIIVIVAIWCLLTTAPTAFEYELVFGEECTRNCTAAELKKMQYNSQHGNSLQNTTIHYLPNHTIVVTNIQNTDHGQKLASEIYASLQPRLHKLLPSNCTSHPHIIYVPIYPAPATNDTIQFNTDLIERPLKSGAFNNATFPFNGQVHHNLTSPENITINETCCVKKFNVSTTATTLRNSTTYTTIIYWYSAIWFALVPLVLIATFNSFLVYAVYQSQIRRRKMTNSQENVSMSNENRITIMLIGVVILFLICQTPTAAFLIYMNFQNSNDADTDNIYKALGNIFNVLVTVNAACNFLLYCVLSKKYRTTFKSLFCERWRTHRQDTLILSATTRIPNSQRFSSYKNGLRRNISEYRTPRNLETQSLTSIPRSRSLMMRPPGKARSTDLNF